MSDSGKQRLNPTSWTGKDPAQVSGFLMQAEAVWRYGQEVCEVLRWCGWMERTLLLALG